MAVMTAKERIRKLVKPLLKTLLLLAIIAGVVLGAYFIMKACGWTDLQRIRDEWGTSFWTYAIICALQAFQVVFLPITNQIITVPAALVFKDQLFYVFLASWIGIEIGTIALYFLGKYGGKKVVKWILSDEDKTERCANFLKRGKAFYPLGMVIGFIPDDILTTLAGMSGFGFWYVLGVSFATRGICAAASVWGWGFLTRQGWWGWMILIGGLALLLAGTIVMFIWQNKKGKKKNEQADEERIDGGADNGETVQP